MKWTGLAVAALFVFSLASSVAFAGTWKLSDITDEYAFEAVNKDLERMEGAIEAEPTVLIEEPAPVMEEKRAPEMFREEFLPFETQRWDG